MPLVNAGAVETAKIIQMPIANGDFARGSLKTTVVAGERTNSLIISENPSLTTQDNHPASFIVGENVPIPTGSTPSADNKTLFQTADRRDIGTRLTILPQINEGEAVQLKISSEVLRC